MFVVYVTHKWEIYCLYPQNKHSPIMPILFIDISAHTPRSSTFLHLRLIAQMIVLRRKLTDPFLLQQDSFTVATGDTGTTAARAAVGIPLKAAFVALSPSEACELSLSLRTAKLPFRIQIPTILMTNTPRRVEQQVTKGCPTHLK